MNSSAVCQWFYTQSCSMGHRETIRCNTMSDHLGKFADRVSYPALATHVCS